MQLTVVPTARAPRNPLNAAQREAAEYGERTENGFSAGPMLVIAGAGTGKTMTLAHRVAHLVVSGVCPERLLLLTFSRRASLEMTRRVESIVRGTGGRCPPLPSGGLPWAGTYHSIANRLLRRFAGNVGLDPGFTILDRGDAADVMDVARHGLGLSQLARRFPKKDTCLAIYSRCVNTQRPLCEILDSAFPWCGEWETELSDLFQRYVERKQHCRTLDYDDLLLYWSHLVGDTEFAAEIGSWFDHILVDEYQDTNVVQADILHALRPQGQGLTVVGDDAQSIYSFRAADVENILGFPDRFMPSAKIVTLERNYRSSQAILDSANCLIAESECQYRKNLFSECGGRRPLYVTVEDSDAEAEFVTQSVLEARERGSALKDQAVLFRNSHHSDRLELELVRRRIPYVKHGGLRFLEAAHVRDLLSLLKWVENPRNEVAAFRVLKLVPGMGPAAAARCFEFLAVNDYRFTSLSGHRPPQPAAGEWHALCELLVALSAAEPGAADWQPQLAAARKWYQPCLERLYDGIESREADLEQLEQISGRYATRERFLTELTLDPPAASGDLAGDPHADEDYLILSTVHSAKGQEWDAVYVLNVTDGNFPSEFATGKAESIEEERRLLYVAMTRARHSLSLIAPLRFYVTKQHRSGDRHVYGAKSRFMSDRLLQTMDRCYAGRAGQTDGRMALSSNRQIDVASRLRDMWQKKGGD